MTTEQQIKALAELGGLEVMQVRNGDECSPEFNQLEWCYRYPDCSWQLLDDLNYLNSYDAIIPLIQKQDARTKTEIFMWIGEYRWVEFNVTPVLLCEALLRATGKWITE